MSFEIQEATRTGVKPLVGLFGRSGTGKTMSALLLMRGLIGPKARLTLIDSESGRGSLFADIIPGGYKVLNLEPPFSPERYQEAFEVAEGASDGVIYDSLTHEHNGDGGLLDQQEAELTRMAGDNWQKREACKMASWIKPKMAHKKFIQRLLRCKVPLICCLRGEEKTHMIKGDDGKNKVITDQFSSPLFDQRFIFELLLNFETVARDGKGGFVIPRKITHPALAGLLPKEDEQISVRTGEQIRAWCASTGGPGSPASDERKTLLRELWGVAEKVRGTEKGWATFEQWAIKATVLGVDDPLILSMSPEQLRFVLGETRKVLA